MFVSLPAAEFSDFSDEFLAGSDMQKQEIQEKTETQAIIAAICWSFLKIMMHGKKVWDLWTSFCNFHTISEGENFGSSFSSDPRGNGGVLSQIEDWQFLFRS